MAKLCSFFGEYEAGKHTNGASGTRRRSTKPEKAYATFWTFPFLMQDVQTFMRFGAPFTRARTGCRLTFQRRFVTLCAWLMRLPNCGPRPQSSHSLAIDRDLLRNYEFSVYHASS